MRGGGRAPSARPPLLCPPRADAVHGHPRVLPDVHAAARPASDRALSALRRRVPPAAAAETLRRLRQSAAMPCQHPQRDPVPAHAAAAQRLLPIAPAPRRDRGARGAAGSLNKTFFIYGAPHSRGLFLLWPPALDREPSAQHRALGFSFMLLGVDVGGTFTDAVLAF